MDGEHDGVRDGSIPSFGNGGSIPPSPHLEDWLSGRKQRFAKPPRGKTPPKVRILHLPPWQYSSVIEQKIHTLLVGGLIPSTALCR